MRINKKLSTFVVSFAVIIGVTLSLVMANRIYAETPCKDGTVSGAASGCVGHGGSVGGTGSGGGITSAPSNTEDGQKIYDRLTNFINLLSGLVGVVVTASIIYGGIQYSTAGSDPQKVSAAKHRIYNSVFALLAFIFMYAFLQYIVPGGVF